MISNVVLFFYHLFSVIVKKSSSYTIKIGFDYIEPWKTAEEWAENPDKFWRARIDLFSSIEGAREFFRIVKNLKQ